MNLNAPLNDNNNNIDTANTNTANTNTTTAAAAAAAAAYTPLLPLPTNMRLVRHHQLRQLPSAISTGSAQLDLLLGGSGIPLRRITEICGPPGIGKTQLGMQLCVNVQIPLNLGGVQGEAVFIDTHGGFMADRLAQIAEKSMDIISSSAAAATANKSTATLHLLPPHSQTDFIINPLDHIYVIRIHNVMENMAIVNILEEFLDEQPNVKLIVMDSISFHFRTVYNSDTALRQRMLSNLVQTLMRLAHSRNLAVVLMNQLTTKYISRGGGSDSETLLIPALGENWGHACTNRVLMYKDHGTRFAKLLKSPYLNEETVSFSVTIDGIRDPYPATK